MRPGGHPLGENGSKLPHSKVGADVLLPMFLAAGCFALRLAFLGRYPEGWDSINFLLALRRFDLTEGQPHFPGYPVYIFVGSLFQRLLRQDVAALLVAGCLFSSLALLPLYRLSSRLFAPGVATGACLLFVANPLLFLEAEKLFSDAFALLFLVAAVGFTEEATRAGGVSESDARRTATRAGYLAGVSAGLMLGVRVSLWPFVLSMALWLWLRRAEQPGPPLRALVHGGIHGVGVWLIPLLALTNLPSLAAAGADHVRGHFTQWGETAVTQQDPFTRLIAFCWDLGPNGLGLWWPDTDGFRLLTTLLVAVSLGQYGRVHRLGHSTRFLLAFTLPYAVWVFLGQNLANPRHVLPLVALLLPALAAGLLSIAQDRVPAKLVDFEECPPKDRRPPRRSFALSLLRFATRPGRERFGAALCGLLVAAWAITALPLVEQNRSTPPTRVALVSFVRDRYESERTAVVCWNSARFFDYMAPGWLERVVSSVEDGSRLAGRSGVVLVLSDMPRIQAVRQRFPLRPIRSFSRNRYVHNYLHRVTLYELAR